MAPGRLLKVLALGVYKSSWTELGRSEEEASFLPLFLAQANSRKKAPAARKREREHSGDALFLGFLFSFLLFLFLALRENFVFVWWTAVTKVRLSLGTLIFVMGIRGKFCGCSEVISC